MHHFTFRFSFLLVGFLFFVSCQPEKIEGPYLATGIKIGEVTQNDAIIWVRLTQNQQRIGENALFPVVKYRIPGTGDMKERYELSRSRPDYAPVVYYPEGYDEDSIEGATPGSEGRVRLQYKMASSEQWMETDWQAVQPEKDYTCQFALSDLAAGEEYLINVEAAPLKSRQISASLKGTFKTAPASVTTAEVNFIVTTGTSYGDVDTENGYRFYLNALKLDPEFFVHTGDIVYYDSFGKNIELARWHWERMYSYPNNIEFHRKVASYFIKDDHDTWMNDCYPGMETRFMGDFTFEQGKQVFLEQVPMAKRTYRTIRWGKDLQVWLVEGRDYRSPNPMPDGPGKTIWGKEQLTWFKTTVQNSDATFKVLISPTPIVGPDRKGKNDNHSNAGFSYEGNIIRQFMAGQDNMVSVCGDRHWQFISKDAETGLLEFSCGPGGNDHAGGWRPDDKRPEHIYLNVTGGFMEGKVSRKNSSRILTFTHYNPDGKKLNEYRIEK